MTTPSDEDRELRGLAARVRAAGVPEPGAPCPDEDTLRAYRAGALDEAAVAGLDRHLARCTACLLALRALRPVTEADRERLARAAQAAAGPARGGGSWARLSEWLAGWPGRLSLAGAAAAVVLAVVVGLQVGPPDAAAPRYGVAQVTVTAERGAEAPVRTAVIPVERPDAVVRARFAPVTHGPVDPAAFGPDGLGARVLLRAPGATALRPVAPLRLAFDDGGGLELALQAGATFGEGPGGRGPGTYVVWVLIGGAAALPDPAALAAEPLGAAEARLLAGEEEGRWSLQRLEVRYGP